MRFDLILADGSTFTASAAVASRAGFAARIHVRLRCVAQFSSVSAADVDLVRCPFETEAIVSAASEPSRSSLIRVTTRLATAVPFCWKCSSEHIAKLCIEEHSPQNSHQSLISRAVSDSV